MSARTSTMATAESPKKKRWSIFKKKDRDESQLPTVSNSDMRLSSTEQRYPSPQHGQSSSSQQNIQYDSAYASSEPPSVHNEPNIVSVENHGRFNNVSPDRNLAVNKTTGDVLDKDTGEVVSTVTTTTTTTTTTLTKKGKNGETIVDVQTQPAGQTSTSRPTTVPTEIAEAPGDNEHPVHPRSDSAQPQPPLQQRRSPVIPPRSPHRSSRELDSMQSQQAPPNPNPSSYNFSHPARSNLRQSGDWTQPTPSTAQSIPPTRQPTGMQPIETQPSARSTIESLRSIAKEQTSPETYANLKAAAKGLHGVGETLRGVLNNELDTRFPGDAEAMAAARNENQTAIERGRAEMQMGRVAHNRENWNNAGGPANVPGYGAQAVSPIEPQSARWQDTETSSRSSSQRKGLRNMLKKKKSG